MDKNLIYCVNYIIQELTTTINCDTADHKEILYLAQFITVRIAYQNNYRVRELLFFLDELDSVLIVNTNFSEIDMERTKKERLKRFTQYELDWKWLLNSTPMIFPNARHNIYKDEANSFEVAPDYTLLIGIILRHVQDVIGNIKYYDDNWEKDILRKIY